MPYFILRDHYWHGMGDYYGYWDQTQVGHAQDKQSIACCVLAPAQRQKHAVGGCENLRQAGLCLEG